MDILHRLKGYRVSAYMDGTKRVRAEDWSDAIQEIERLRALVVHCWVHSNYHNCGYSHMTTDEKALFDAVTGISNAASSSG